MVSRLVIRSMAARAIMVLGTSSHAGKSLLAAAICRILSDEGYRVAPFKAQNMSLNSAATPDGHEISRSQAMQAEAARVTPSVEMNPILLKPISDTQSQLVLLGRACGNITAAKYFKDRVNELFPIVEQAYWSLAQRFDIIVLEGAGSPAEINLRASDIVNMRMADAADARCLLVGDIERGGVFASLFGTLALIRPDERARITAFIINKFRGERSLLDSGIADIEHLLDLPCAGVIPWLSDVCLDEEDSVSLEGAPRVAGRAWASDGRSSRALRIAIIALPHLSNFTDFEALRAEADVDVAYASRPEELDFADVVMLPGTKNTLGALRWLDEKALGKAILTFAKHGLVVGICGGMQILGLRVEDPLCIESGGALDGLGFLPLHTRLEREKLAVPVRVHMREGGFFGVAHDSLVGSGYEIHAGRSVAQGSSLAFADLQRADNAEFVPDGAVSADRRVFGTYVHGLFDDDQMRHAFIRAARFRCGLSLPVDLKAYTAQRSSRFDRLAAHVRLTLNLSSLLR
jgi:adenosylcobyric acid synthase